MSKQESRKNSEDNISTFLNSKPFTNYLSSINPERRVSTISNVVILMLVFPDVSFRKMIDELKANPGDKFDFLVKFILIEVFKNDPSKRSLDNLDDREKELVYSFVYDNYYAKGFLYHGFNSSFYKAISERGLNDPGSKDEWIAETNEIEELFSKLKNPLFQRIFGYFSSKDRKGKVYFGDSPQVAIGYSFSSPEWFEYFTGMAPYYAGKDFEGVQPSAFLMRDYQSARKNIEILLSLSVPKIEKGGEHLAVIDKEKILTFFEKYWNKYATKRQYSICIVQRTDIIIKENGALLPNTFPALQARFKDIDIKQALQMMIGKRNLEYDTEEQIPPSQFRIVNPPSLNYQHKLF